MAAIFVSHTGVGINTCVFQKGYQLSNAASAMPLGLYFWHSRCGMKRKCWSTGSWQCCLSLEVASSVLAWSTIIHQFLCGWYAFPCIKVKPTNMCVYIYVWIYACMHVSSVKIRTICHARKLGSVYLYTYISTYIHVYTCLLLLIVMLWHRQAIFESKGDKLSSSAECRIRTMVSGTESPNIHIYIIMMDTWQNMFRNGNTTQSGSLRH